QESFRWALIQIGDTEILAHARRLPDAKSGGDFFVSVELHNIEPHSVRDSGDAFRRFVHEDTDLPYRTGKSGNQLCCLIRIDVSRDLGIKIESQRRSAAVSRRRRVVPVGDATNLDHHATSR